VKLPADAAVDAEIDLCNLLRWDDRPRSRESKR